MQTPDALEKFATKSLRSEVTKALESLVLELFQELNAGPTRLDDDTASETSVLLVKMALVGYLKNASDECRAINPQVPSRPATRVLVKYTSARLPQELLNSLAQAVGKVAFAGFIDAWRSDAVIEPFVEPFFRGK